MESLVVEREVTVGHAKLHARAAAELVGLAKQFRSTVEIENSGTNRNAKSPMGVLALGAVKGDTVKVLAEGSDEAEAAEAVAAFVAGDGSL
jgi:phosphocarrier protein HPr